MAKLTRITQKIFAETAGATGITEFGSPAGGTPVYTTDAADMQTAAWLNGWAAAALAGTEIPTFQDFNAIHNVTSRQIGYLLQEGIAEYDVATTYYANSIVKKTGTYEIYGSIDNNNIGNALPSAVSDANWEYLGTLGQAANPISWGGTAGGTANALTLTPATPLTAYSAGQVISFLPASNNTGAVTINVSTLGAQAITKNGSIALTANELVAGKVTFAIYDGTQFQLINTNAFAKGADVASASTVNLTSTTGNIVDITGTTTITAVTLPEGQKRFVRFTGVLTLTNGASLILPTAGNIVTAAGDTAILTGYGSGVVRVEYFRIDGSPINQLQGANIASATTTTLDVASDFFQITGTTTITSLGAASRAGIEKTVYFAGALILTHNGTSLILPSAANITTAAGDSAIFRSLGGSNWKCVNYEKADGKALISGTIIQRTYAEHLTVTSCGTIPEDNTIPQNTEGTQILTSSITMANATNRLRISGTVQGASGATGLHCVAIFKDSVADAIFATGSANTDASKGVTIPFMYEFTPAAAGSITINVRAGAGTSTFYTNADRVGTRIYGGVAACTLILEEISA